MDISKNWKKDIIIFLSSQTISLFGSMLVQYAIVWYITLKTQSGVMMTLTIICGFVPTFFISPFGGVWADRYNRKLLIALADGMIALSTLVLAIVFMLGYNSIWLLFVTLAIRAAGAGIQTPAVSAMLPSLVPEEMLTKVNGVNGSIQSLVMLVSPMLSGALLSFTSIETIFFIDVVTAAIAITILLLLLHVPIHAKALEKQKVSYFTDMYEGIRYIKNHGFVKTLFVFCGIFFIIAAPVSFLTPLQVTRSFGSDVWRLTAIEMTFSIGMLLGGIFIASWGGFKNKIHSMALSSLVMAVCTFSLGTVPVFWIYIFFMAMIGFVMPLFNTPFTVLLQQTVEPDFLGRVFGVLSMISSSIMPLSMLVFGPLSDAVKIEWLLIGTSVFIFAEGIIMLRNKTLLEAGKT